MLQQRTILYFMVLYFKIEGYNNSTTIPIIMLSCSKTTHRNFYAA
jgi:hypothetical protein